ncbi:MAG: energy-coupling factor transporter transmembrane protein EcfT [Clostridia bacterium]|nr:energy-coupling factor transporter transmembrane protein EcfT [Clostridia bacterium]
MGKKKKTNQELENDQEMDFADWEAQEKPKKSSRKGAFATYHPIVIFFYFAIVILIGMFVMHPIFLLISLFSAFVYSIYLNGKRSAKFNFLLLLPVLILITIFNGLFTHAGVTTLFYPIKYIDVPYLWPIKWLISWIGYNPITLEALVYGFAAGMMLITVICWFSCYNAVMTSDKFIYLFGRIIPGLSLILSMVLRFVPMYKNQIKVISNAQKCIGRDFSSGSWFEKLRNGIKIVSIMVTWALENALETSDSMRSRGYGLKGRTSFSMFRFDNRDKLVFGLMIGLLLLIMVGAAWGVINVTFYPSIIMSVISPLGIVVDFAYLAFCLMPLFIDIMEVRKWRYLESKI